MTTKNSDMVIMCFNGGCNAVASCWWVEPIGSWPMLGLDPTAVADRLATHRAAPGLGWSAPLATRHRWGHGAPTRIFVILCISVGHAVCSGNRGAVDAVGEHVFAARISRWCWRGARPPAGRLWWNRRHMTPFGHMRRPADVARSSWSARIDIRKDFRFPRSVSSCISPPCTDIPCLARCALKSLHVLQLSMPPT